MCRPILKAERIDLKEEVMVNLERDINMVSVVIPANKICTIKFSIN